MVLMKKLFSLMLIGCLLLMFAFSASASGTLVYSNLSSIPSGYSNYNCYGYALNTYQNVDPGAYSYHTGYDLATTGIVTLASYVADDLTALGYTVVGTYSYCPTLSTGQKAICIARDYWTACYSSSSILDGTGNRANESWDYHCYKKTSPYSPWYHKMGTSSALMTLKSSYTPSTITITDECFNGNGVACPACWYFPSPGIRYIVYT